MHLSEFAYQLPERLIAQEPATPRGTALPTAMKDVYRSSPTTPGSATHA